MPVAAPTPTSPFFTTHPTTATVRELLAAFTDAEGSPRWLVVDPEGTRWTLRPHDCLCHPQVRYVGTRAS